MSGRPIRSAPRPEQASLRLLGDPGLAGALRAAVGASGVESFGRSVGLDVYSTRRRFDEDALRSARESTARRRGFLLLAIEWGRGAVGPFVRPERTDACVDCLYTRLAKAREAESVCHDPPPCEVALLPGLVAAIAAREIERFFRGAAPSLANARVHVTPFVGANSASAPVLVRTEVHRLSACATCGEAPPNPSPHETERWGWLEETRRSP
jgi:hypothetical protein